MSNPHLAHQVRVLVTWPDNLWHLPPTWGVIWLSKDNKDNEDEERVCVCAKPV